MNERFPYLKTPPPSPGMPVSRPPPSPRGSSSLRYDPSPYSSSSSLRGLERAIPPPIFPPAFAPSPSLSARSGTSRASRTSRISQADLQKPLPPAPAALPPPPIPSFQANRPPTRRGEAKDKRGRRRNSSESSGRSSVYSQRQMEDEILDLYYAIQQEQKALRDDSAREEEMRMKRERKENARTRKEAVEKISKRRNLPSPPPLRPSPSTASDPARARRSEQPPVPFSFGPRMKHGQTYQRRNSDIPVSPTQPGSDLEYGAVRANWNWEPAPWERTEKLANQYRQTLLPRTEWPPTPPIPLLRPKKKNDDLSVLPYTAEITYAPRPMSSRITDVDLSAPGPSYHVPAPLAFPPGRSSLATSEEGNPNSYLSWSESSSSSSGLRPMRSLRTSARKIFHRPPHQRDTSTASNISAADSARSRPSGEMLRRGQGSMRRTVEDMYETVTLFPLSPKPELRLSRPQETAVHVLGREERSPAIGLSEYQTLGPVEWDRQKEKDRFYSRGKDKDRERNEDRGSGFGWFKERKKRSSEEKQNKRREELKKKIVIKGVEEMGMGRNYF